MTMSLTPLINRFYHEVWNTADEEVAREILHRDFQFRGSLGPLKSGPEGFISYMRDVHAALDTYTCTIVSIVDGGAHAAARMTFSGVHRAPFFGVPATGRSIEWSGAAFFTGAKGQITSLWVLGDVDAIKTQLGGADKSLF